jgi:hypothetical protein
MTRTGERGIVRGCCAGLILLLVVVGGGAFVADRALAAPALGAAPAGPSHGGSEEAIALALGTSMAAQLLTGANGVVVLSERDLTVLAVANNPHPNTYRNLQVRVRNGRVVASAQVSVGPFSPTVVTDITLALRPGSSGPVIAAQVREIDIGLIGLPGFLATGLVAEIDSALSLQKLFSVDPRLNALRTDIECVAIVPGGVAVGIHSPGTATVASSCG